MGVPLRMHVVAPFLMMLACCQASPSSSTTGAKWSQTGTGHPRVDDKIYDHYSAPATDVSLAACEAACAGFDQCVGINYNEDNCWVFSDGCAPSTWGSVLSGFEHAAYADCPTGSPNNFLLENDLTLQWFANPSHQECGTFTALDACPTTNCVWDGSTCQSKCYGDTDCLRGSMCMPKGLCQAVASESSRNELARRLSSGGPSSCGPSSGGPSSSGPSSSGPSMCGDPITRFNGKSIQFWIPLDTDIKLITLDSLTLFGMARKRTSLRSMQWFSDFTLQYNGDTVLHIGCKNIVSMGMAKIAAMAPPAKLGAGVPMRFLDLTSMDEEGEKKS